MDRIVQSDLLPFPAGRIIGTSRPRRRQTRRSQNAQDSGTETQKQKHDQTPRGRAKQAVDPPTQCRADEYAGNKIRSEPYSQAKSLARRLDRRWRIRLACRPTFVKPPVKFTQPAGKFAILAGPAGGWPGRIAVPVAQSPAPSEVKKAASSVSPTESARTIIVGIRGVKKTRPT
jgi:hypothetical protein